MSAVTDNPISPNHYARFKIQPITFIMENGLGFCAGNVIKYVCRHDAKNGLEDLKKARNYLDKMIEEKEREAAPKLIPPGPVWTQQSFSSPSRPPFGS